MVMQRVGVEEFDQMQSRIDEAAERAKRVGDHLWVATVAYFIADPDSTNLNLDRENLAMYPAVGCWVCEEPYERRLRHRRCKGEPR